MPRHDDAAGSVQQAGAGSAIRMSWPAGGAGLAAPAVGFAKFPQANTGTAIGATTSFAGGTTTANIVRLGANSLRLNSTVGTGSAVAPNMFPNVFTERAGGQLNTDFLAFSWRVTMSIPALTGPLGNRECGLVMVCGARNNNPVSSNQAGVSIGPTDVANASVRIRAWATDGIVGAPTVNVALLTTIDYTLWHTWEIRGVWGSASADPYLQVLVDGIPQSARISWTAAAGLLPTIATALAASAGYFGMGCVNNSNAIAASIHVSSWTFTMANSAAGLA